MAKLIKALAAKSDLSLIFHVVEGENQNLQGVL